MYRRHRRGLTFVAMFAFGCVASMGCVQPTTAQVDGGDDTGLLLDKPWRELAHGISMHPPRGAKLIYNAGDSSVLRAEGRGYLIRTFIKRSKISLRAKVGRTDPSAPRQGGRERHPIENLVDIAHKEMTLTRPSVMLTWQQRRFGGKDGAWIVFRVKDKERGDRAVVQTFMVIDDFTFLLVQLDCGKADYSVARPTYDAVVNSITVESAKDVRERRVKWTSAALEWHKSVTADRLHKAIQPEQLFRITRNGKMVGWMLMTQARVKGWEAAKPSAQPKVDRNARTQPRRSPRRRIERNIDKAGIVVTIKARVYMGTNDFFESVLDVDCRSYLSDDRKSELWNHRFSLRPLVAKRKAVGQVMVRGTESDVIHAAWADSGIREEEMITVSIETPNGVKYHEWQRPPKVLKMVEYKDDVSDEIIRRFDQPGFAYLSQVEWWMLPQLLPRNERKTYGFYTYRGLDVTRLPGLDVHAVNVTGAMSFSFASIAPGPPGELHVAAHPTLTSAARGIVCDATNRQTRWTLPNGLRFEKTTREALAVPQAKAP